MASVTEPAAPGLFCLFWGNNVGYFADALVPQAIVRITISSKNSNIEQRQVFYIKNSTDTKQVVFIFIYLYYCSSGHTAKFDSPS